MTVWRDLADQLRPDQIRDLEHLESLGDAAETVLHLARGYVAENLINLVEFDGIEPPRDAVRTHGWEARDDGRWFREFEGPPITIGEVSAFVMGRQLDDGLTGRGVMVLTPSDDKALTPTQARELADVLRAMADAADSE
jgi:hypothetical protein